MAGRVPHLLRPVEVEAPLCAESRRVLVIGYFSSAAASTRSLCEDLAARLASAGWSVLTASAEPNRWRRLIEMIATVWNARSRYDVACVDVYSGRAFASAEAVCAILTLAHRPYVLVLRGGELPDFARRWPRRVGRLLRSAAAVCAPSGFLQRALAEYRTGIEVISNPLDVSSYPWRLRRRLRPNLVWTRAFHRVYDPALAPRVVAELLPDAPDVVLTMIGPDKGDGTLEETRAVARELGVLERIRIVGGVPKREIPDRLAEADIFLNTTNADNAPVSVLEALACGLCVVSTNVGGLPILLEEGRDALLVPPGDHVAMARSVRQLLDDQDLAASLSRNGRRKAESYDWSVVLPQWDAFLRAASRGRPGAAPVTNQNA